MRLQLGVVPARPDDVVTKEYVDADIVGFPSMSNHEVPSGVIDGANAIFTLEHTPVPGSEMVYANGLMQGPGAGNDYQISGPTITFLTPPPLDTILVATYWFTA
jgi:hypothetical protein